MICKVKLAARAGTLESLTSMSPSKEDDTGRVSSPTSHSQKEAAKKKAQKDRTEKRMAELQWEVSQERKAALAESEAMAKQKEDRVKLSEERKADAEARREAKRAADEAKAVQETILGEQKREREAERARFTR